MLPNYLVIGAPKAATTAICTHLGRHPEVFMSHPKEPFFFAYDDVYRKGIQWYQELFRDAQGKKAIGEGSTVYAQLKTFPNTLQRILEHVPDAKIIYAVRHPLDRIVSHWVEMTSQGLTQLPFNQAVREDIQYLDASSYHFQLTQYLDHFRPERVKVVFFEEFEENPDRVLRDCFEFLEVDPDFVVPEADQRIYGSEGKRADKPLTNLLRRYVPGFLALRNLTPRPVREFAKAYLKAELRKPHWDESTRNYAISQLEEDTARFLKLVGKPADFWSFK